MDKNNEYGCKAIQEALLPLMKAFHQLCVENEIKYVAAWGTALGAVRHNGFIPWDDDVDVDMRREEYQKLKECIKKSDILALDCDYRTVGRIPRVRFKNMGKISGYEPTLDIFFIDNIPDGSIMRRIHLYAVLLVQNTLRPKLVLKGSLPIKIASFVSHVIGLPFTLNFKCKVYEKVCTWYNGNKTKKTGSLNTEYIDMRKTYDGDVLEHVVEKSFEDMVVFLPSNTHQFMVDQFGEDYMTPPTDKKPKHID